jgi:DNA-damage-inducible protein D
MTNNNLALFQGVQIRKTFHQEEWWFAINDVVQVLTDSADPAQYFKRIRSRDAELDNLIREGGVQFVPPLRLKLDTAGGSQKLYCWNTKGIFMLAPDFSRVEKYRIKPCTGHLDTIFQKPQ